MDGINREPLLDHCYHVWINYVDLLEFYLSDSEYDSACSGAVLNRIYC
jgi:hypothetical protein